MKKEAEAGADHHNHVDKNNPLFLSPLNHQELQFHLSLQELLFPLSLRLRQNL